MQAQDTLKVEHSVTRHHVRDHLPFVLPMPDKEIRSHRKGRII